MPPKNRNENYQRLTAVGYSNKEATKFRDRSKTIVNELIALKLWANKQKEPIEQEVRERMEQVLCGGNK